MVIVAATFAAKPDGATALDAAAAAAAHHRHRAHANGQRQRQRLL